MLRITTVFAFLFSLLGAASCGVFVYKMGMLFTENQIAKDQKRLFKAIRAESVTNPESINLVWIQQRMGEKNTTLFNAETAPDYLKTQPEKQLITRQFGRQMLVSSYVFSKTPFLAAETVTILTEENKAWFGFGIVTAVAMFIVSFSLSLISLKSGPKQEAEIAAANKQEPVTVEAEEPALQLPVTPIRAEIPEWRKVKAEILNAALSAIKAGECEGPALVAYNNALSRVHAFPKDER